MSKDENMYVLTIGDWSCDGHSMYRQYGIKTNESLENLRKAYFDSCNKSGVKFHDEKDYDIENTDYREVCTKSNDGEISKEAELRLVKFGMDMESERYQRHMWYNKMVFEDVENFAFLVMDFVQKSLPSMDYSLIDLTSKKAEKLNKFNGFWQNGFNFGFGYGLNDCFDEEGPDYHGDCD